MTSSPECKCRKGAVQPSCPRHNNDDPSSFGKDVPGLQLDADAVARLKKFHEDGLVYLVNTAVLHPRGLALAVHLDNETGEPVGLSVVGDGDEPWCFGDELEDVVERYHTAERAREAAWSPKLQEYV